MHRLTATLQDLRDVFGGGRKAFLARELTKIHESVYGETLADLCRKAASGTIVPKGEFTLVVGGADRPDGNEAALDSVLKALLQELPTAQAARLGAELAGVPRRVAYRRALELQAREQTP